jgi:N6-L-threonylcarbamoyladenine synthase
MSFEKKNFILGIETSCDETSAAVIDREGRVLSHLIRSQIETHEIYGGVVPEIASRSHYEALHGLVEEALSKAQIQFDDLRAISVTQQPGLIGSLLVGLTAAKAYAYALRCPLIGVDHLKAHLAAPFLKTPAESEGWIYPSEEMAKPQYPFLGLLVSGGHTALYWVKTATDFELIGQTHDDAAGEALDKAGKLLHLPYPGGVSIDEKAKSGNREAFSFPRGIPEKARLEFSYSGLKTSLSHLLSKQPDLLNSQLHDLCASYLEAVVDPLVKKTFLALQEIKKKPSSYGQNPNQKLRLVIAGGVASNSRLRERFAKLQKDYDFDLWIPHRNFCTDNGAMIAVLGSHMLDSMGAEPFFEYQSMNAFASSG